MIFQETTVPHSLLRDWALWILLLLALITYLPTHRFWAVHQPPMLGLVLGVNIQSPPTHYTLCCLLLLSMICLKCANTYHGIAAIFSFGVRCNDSSNYHIHLDHAPSTNLTNATCYNGARPPRTYEQLARTYHAQQKPSISIA